MEQEVLSVDCQAEASSVTDQSIQQTPISLFHGILFWSKLLYE